MDKIESKLDQIVKNISDINVTVAKMEVHVEKNTADLEVHMKRTELNEVRISNLENSKRFYEGVSVTTKFILTLIILPIALHFIKSLI